MIAPIDPNNAAFANTLGGARRTRDVELGETGSITKNLGVMGAYAYLDGKFTRRSCRRYGGQPTVEPAQAKRILVDAL